MRKAGRPNLPPRGNSWQTTYPRTRALLDEGGPVFAAATKTTLGITFVLIHRWTGKLLRQADYPWSLIREVSGEDLERFFMDFFRRPASPQLPVGVPGTTPMPEPLEQAAPTLGHFLCAGAWPDGEVRQRSTLVIFVEDGSWKACLSDKDSNTSLWAGSKTFDGLLGALEGRLTDDQPDWRKSRVKGKKT